MLLISPRNGNANLIYRKLRDIIEDEAIIGDTIEGEGLLVDEIGKLALAA